MYKEIFFQSKIGLILIYLNEIFPIKPSEFEFSLSFIGNDKKTTESCPNFYDAEKRIISKLSKILISNLIGTTLKLESKLYLLIFNAFRAMSS